ncbi:hypothetical protein Syun_018647 [Stephania yunnanensis]|uniref:Uncharacterized protein n=1 Tax=Stephania yunnanensis TaxID=152371 RepID=A0AAP0NX79_9MAGN
MLRSSPSLTAISLYRNLSPKPKLFVVAAIGVVVGSAVASSVREVAELYGVSAPLPSIPSASPVPSTSSSRTIPNCTLQSPSPTSRHDTSVPMRFAPLATASPAASPSYDDRAGLQVYFRWDDAIHENLIRAAYDTHAGTRYTALMHKLKKNRIQPNFVIDEAWRRYLEYWDSEDFLARSRQGSTNRNTEVEGPGRSMNNLQRRRLELTQATPDQSVDDEAVYFNVAGECPKGRIYGLESLGRKKRRYADPGASTSQMPEMMPRSEFDIVVDQLQQVLAFMQRQFRMTMDGAGLSQLRPPPPPHDHHHQPQIDP